MSTVSSSTWADFLTGIAPEQRWLLLVIAIGCGLGLIISLATFVMNSIGSMQRHRAEINLKRELVERGMSADEIATIIQAGASKNAPQEL